MTKSEELKLAVEMITKEISMFADGTNYDPETSSRILGLLELERVRYEVRLAIVEAKTESSQPASLME